MPAIIRQWFAAGSGRRQRAATVPPASAQPEQNAVGAADHDPSSWYLQQAREFEKSKVDAANEKAKIADRRSKLFGVVALAAVFGMGALGILKRPNPPAVLRVNDTNGKVDLLPTTATGHVTFTEKTDRADLHRYVEMRESYDWETIQDMHDAVMVMSDDHEKDQYDALVRGPASPLKLLKDQARVIAKVGSITFVNTTAQVFFSRSLIPLNAGASRPEPTYWIATIAFTRVDVPEKADAQDVDPDGFRVTSYTVTRDWSRAPAYVTPQAAPASSTEAAGPAS